ncbi:MAG TPA: hypothetical protein VK211_21150 [Kamptonema sp.]|nr:hypothetical protein [Kamptonema sp.]
MILLKVKSQEQVLLLADKMKLRRNSKWYHVLAIAHDDDPFVIPIL